MLSITSSLTDKNKTNINTFKKTMLQGCEEFLGFPCCVFLHQLTALLPLLTRILPLSPPFIALSQSSPITVGLQMMARNIP